MKGFVVVWNGSLSDAAYGQILTSLKNMLITHKALSEE